jgi:hypothetical protein
VTAEKKSNGVSIQKIDRNLRGLVDALFDELDGMRDGTGSPDRVRQVCQIAGRINALVNTEMKFRKIVGNVQDNEARVKAITG